MRLFLRFLFGRPQAAALFGVTPPLLYNLSACVERNVGPAGRQSLLPSCTALRPRCGENRTVLAA